MTLRLSLDTPHGLQGQHHRIEPQRSHCVTLQSMWLVMFIPTFLLLSRIKYVLATQQDQIRSGYN
jgi:hypothetical protein